MGRFKGGNHPGNGKSDHANGKGNFDTTDQGDHILGTPGDDNGDYAGAEATDIIQADAVADFDETAAGLASDSLLINLQDGNDLFNGFAGNDWVYGGDDDDNLNGGEGDDVLVGGDGDDTIEGGAGADYIDGSAGNDTASYADSTDLEEDGTGVSVDLLAGSAAGDDATGDVLVSIENLIGSDFDDTLTGDDNANVLVGGDGDDTIDGGAGDDTIVGGKGDDGIVGGTGQDTLFGGNGGDDDTINVGTAGSLDGRDAEDDVIVAAGSYAENGTDAIFNYDESSHPAVNNDDVFDFSEAFDFTSADSNLWAGELDTFLTFDQANGEIETAGDSTQVWFTVSELDATETFNPAEQVSVLVDNALFMNDGTGWTLVDADIMV